MLEVCSLMKNDGVHKEWRFLGRRFFSCLDRFSTLKNIMYDLSLRNRFVLEHHPKSFAPYRCYCKGRDLVLVATGQTLARYRFKSDAVHVGVNRAFMGTSSRKRFDNKFDSFAESEQPLSRVDFLPIR